MRSMGDYYSVGSSLFSNTSLNLIPSLSPDMLKQFSSVSTMVYNYRDKPLVSMLDGKVAASGLSFGICFWIVWMI